MATEVQIALQPQAGQDPAAALSAAAAKLARSSLEMLVQQAGQPLNGKIIAPPPNLPTGFSQVAVADMVLTLKLSTPLPTGTPVRIDVQQSPAGQPAVTVQPMPQSVAPAPAPSAPMTQAPLPLPQPTAQQPQPALQQPVPTVPTNAAPPPSSAAPTTTSQPSMATATPPAPQAVVSAPISSQPSVPATAQSGPVPALAPPPPAPVPVVVSAVQPAVTPVPTPAPQAAPPQGSVPQPTPAPAPVPMTTAPAPAVPPQPTPIPQYSQPTPMPPQTVAQVAATSVPTSPTPAQAATVPSSQPQSPAVASPAAPQASSPAPSPTPTPPQSLVQRLTQAFAPPQAAAPSPPPVPGSPAQLVMAATTQAAAQQQSPAPLMQALAVNLPHLPPPVAEAAARVLASRVNLDRGAPTAETLKQAVLKSGIFLEAPAKAGSSPDLKQALGQLRGTLLAWLGDDVAPVVPVARRPPPPAPARGTTPRAQAPELPPATEGGTREAGKSLLGQTEGALARLKLMQLGTHPAEAARPGAAAAAPGEWRLELPMVLGHELAMAQIQIQRDGKGKAEAKEKNWRLRFALRFSVLGEVGAQVSMVGARTSIAIWADEEATAETLEAMLPELAPSLAARGLELVSLTVRRGAPRDENQQAGRLMDSTR